MIRENQRLLNGLNVLSDGAVVYLALPVAFWIRFFFFSGVVTVPLSDYMRLALILTATHLFTYAALGLYRSFRKKRLEDELTRLWLAGAINMAGLLSFLFIQRGIHYSRWTLAIYFLLSCSILSAKRILLRLLLRYFRKQGYNQKHVLLLGSGPMAQRYLREIRSERGLGYHAIGYIASRRSKELEDVPYLGSFDKLEEILERKRPDEAISAVGVEDYHHTPAMIEACEKTGTKLSIIPIYAEYISSARRFDEFNGIPLMNIRHIPLDNWANAFCKRAMDIVGSLLLLILTSPIMLACAIGVRLSSPGPIIFRQERVGLNKKPFQMYKFRSMRVNARETTGWSCDHDDRKTKFGSFIRKCSLDEFPQFFNVLKGDMSLVGPRPELPHFVEQFREEIPLYMVKHQVRPGITGWAQVNDLRGDTSIKARIEHDIYYIEHWNLLFDVKILLMTVFQRKFLNHEELN